VKACKKQQRKAQPLQEPVQEEEEWDEEEDSLGDSCTDSTEEKEEEEDLLVAVAQGRWASLDDRGRRELLSLSLQDVYTVAMGRVCHQHKKVVATAEDQWDAFHGGDSLRLSVQEGHVHFAEDLLEGDAQGLWSLISEAGGHVLLEKPSFEDGPTPCEICEGYSYTSIMQGSTLSLLLARTTDGLCLLRLIRGVVLDGVYAASAPCQAEEILPL